MVAKLRDKPNRAFTTSAVRFETVSHLHRNAKKGVRLGYEFYSQGAPSMDRYDPAKQCSFQQSK